MAKKKKEAVFFEEDAFYHVYNCAVGGQRLFKSDENFRFFLRKFAYYLYPVVGTNWETPRKVMPWPKALNGGVTGRNVDGGKELMG